MGAQSIFLQEFPERPLPELNAGLSSKKLILGKGEQPLEVAVLTSANAPRISILKQAQKKRKNRRAAPVLLTVIHGDQVSLCGPSGENPPIHQNISLDLAEKLCRTALNRPNRHYALKFCSRFLPSIETGLFGLNNRGMLSLHYLIHGVKKRPDWQKAQEHGKTLQPKKGEDLLKELGFHITRLDNLTYILKSRDKKRALAVFLKPSEDHESKEQRFNQLSPVHYALDKADQENMPWVLMVQEGFLRLYRADKELGVAHGPLSETYIECQLNLLREENLGYLHLIFSAEALREGGSFYKILENSKRFSADSAKNLKTRIYDKIVPQIAKGIFHAKKLQNPSSEELAQTYHSALTVLFRLLFIAHAEDRDLLPYNTNSAYRKRSLKQKAQELSELFLKGGEPDDGDSHWRETASLWKAIDKGNSEWGITAYNGGLFSGEKSVSQIGFEISKLSLSNKFFVPALKSLLLMETEEENFAPVDFRCMGPKEFGTVYEGLLESGLSIAQDNLILDTKNVYSPSKKSENSRTGKQRGKKIQKITVHKGEVYLHNQSGARKASGSYYTKNFAVEHILDKSLNPALKEHFKKLDKLPDKSAEKEFFNFFTADIAMGSGHFLIAAVDRIEKWMADYLDNRPLPAVQDKLNKMKDTAANNLRPISGNDFPVEDKKLLARHIARHCIYGVDNNALAVELAKLSLWSHTFVPGLPLSYFNHNLICGNSLVGIGTVAEFQSSLKNKKESPNMAFDLIDREKLIGQAEKPLQEMKRLSDLSLEEVNQSREIQKQIKDSLKGTKALFDVMLFNRIKNKGNTNKIEGLILSWMKNSKTIHKSKELKAAREALNDLQVLHFPIAFPEVFLRKRPGFDVIIGNPPWEKIKLEEHAFWAGHFPGLRGLSQREREAEYQKFKRKYPHLVTEYETELSKVNKLKNILKQSSFSQTGSGDSDLYKFFCWRFWNLICAEGGFLGVVLKGSVCQSKGSEDFRKKIFRKSEPHITTLVNTLGWVFEGVDGIRISILSLKKRNQPHFKVQNNSFETGHQKISNLSVLKMKKSCQNQGRFGSKKIINGPHSDCADKIIHIQGPFCSLEEFQAGKNKPAMPLAKSGVLQWTDSAALPSLPREDSLDVFLQLRKSPRLDLNDGTSWKVRPDTELHTTNSKPLMDLKSQKCPQGFWPVWTGRSFNIWTPDTGRRYAYANPKKVIKWLYEKRLRSYQNQRRAHSEFSNDYVRDKSTLPCFSPRIAFRDVGSSDRPRTVHVSLLPPKIFLVHKAPYLLFPRGDEKDEAFLLGILSSIPLDWYARRLISTNSLGFFLFNTFPVPRPSRTNPLWKRVVVLSGRLAAPDKRFAKWASAVGVNFGPIDEKRKRDMIHELDAVSAHLYDLSEKQLIHIFETFHRTGNCQPHLQAVLKHYNSLKKRSKTG